MKKNSIVTIVLLLMGISFFLGGIFLIKEEIAFKKNAEEVVCKIVDIEETRKKTTKGKWKIDHDVYVSYTYDGKSYDRVPINIYKSSMRVGQDITLYCNPDDPSVVKSPDMQIFGNVVMMLFGAVFSFLGYRSFKSNKKKSDLLKNGKTIFATIESIDEDSSFTYNGQNTYILNCVYEEEWSGKIYRFAEKHLRGSQCTNFHPGNKVKVIVQPDDYNQYYIVLEEGEVVA